MTTEQHVQRPFGSFPRLALLSLALSSAMTSAQAQTMAEQQPMAGVELILSVAEHGVALPFAAATTRSQEERIHRLRTNSFVTICLEATRNGVVSLWGTTRQNRLERIYPNAHSHPDGDTMLGVNVTAGEPICIGDEGEVKFRVGDPGDYRITLHWSANAASALPVDAYPEFGPRSFAVPEAQASHASTSVAYSVSP